MAYVITRNAADAQDAVQDGIVKAWRALGRFRAAAPAPSRIELGSVTVAPDERGVRLRPGVVHGPGELLLRYPVELRPNGKTLHVRQTGTRPLWSGKRIVLREGQRVVIG